EVGGFEGELRAISANQHVGEDRDRVASLDDPMHMGQRLQELRALNGDLHARLRSIRMGTLGLQKGQAAAVRRARVCAGGTEIGVPARFRQGRSERRGVFPADSVDGQVTSAADLRSQYQVPRVRSGTSNRKAALGS